MLKGFLSSFIIIVLIIAGILYIYGRKTLTDINTEASNQVENTKAADIEPKAMQQWMDYAPPSKKFSAKFPSLPQHAIDRSTDSKTQEPKQYDMYISEAYGKVYMIGVISFLKKEKKDEEAILKSTVEDMVSSNPSNKLEKIQYDKLDGHKMASFLISNNSYSIQGRAFMDKNELYVLSSITKNPNESQKDFEYFVSSFKLNAEPPTLIPKEK